MTNYKVSINGRELDVSVVERSGSNITLVIDGEKHTVQLSYQAPQIVSANSNAHSRPTTPLAPPTQKPQTPIGAIVSPMPGIVVSVKVTAGESITAGQTVAVIEAMKMENNIISTNAGKVKAVQVKAGQEISANQSIITLEV